MARLQRVVLPGYPLHMMVRGHNSQNIFTTEEEKKSYLGWLKDAAREYELAIHAYALMPNHVHILATPKTVLSASKVMQSIGRRYAQLFNQAHGSSGTVWEGRFKSCLIDPEAYFLLVQKYIEQNPVRAGLVHKPEEWAWSSYRHHVGSETTPWIADHSSFWAIANTPFERQMAWQKTVLELLSSNDIEKVSKHLSYGWPLASDTFLKQLTSKTSRPLQPRLAGRPKKT
jgi:putative transposase